MKYFLLLVFFIFSLTSNYSQDLTGKWKLEANIKGFGVLNILIDITKTSDTTFTASSRPSALKDVIGGLQYAVATNNKIYKNGSLVHIYDGVIQSDSLKGIFTTPIMNLYFVAQLKDGKMTGALFGRDRKNKYYTFNAIPYKNDFVNYDYISLVTGMENVFQNNIYNPGILKAKEWRDFFEKLNNLAPKVHDDLEMFIDFSFLVSKINVSHISLSKNSQEINFNDTTKYEKKVLDSLINSRVAYIKFTEFELADTTIVRQFFKKIIKQNIPNLIIDLRECSGGDQSSMFLAQYLITDTKDAGIFVGNKYYQSNKNLPDDSTIRQLVYFDGESLKDFLKTIIDNGLLKGQVLPDRELHYNGKVWVLIDNSSMSATEPIAYFLKQNDLATLVGETTAGKMLSATFFTIQDSWNLFLPIADYFTSDKFHIEQNGVIPNIKVKTKDALDYVLKKIL